MANQSTLFIKWQLLIILFFIFLSCCQKNPTEYPDFVLPEHLQGLLSLSDCDACSSLTMPDHTSPGSILIRRTVTHPELGSTFYVNIDFDRSIINLRPVRDKRESIVLYDPHHLISEKSELNTHYIQSRCTCGGNRFKLALGLVYPPDKSGDEFEQFILAGNCTLCGESRVLFIR